MRKNDLISSLFFLVCGLLIAAASLRMHVGRLGEPGPGYLPLIVGVLMTLLSVALFIRALRLKTAEQAVAVIGLNRKERFKVIATSLSLILYAVAFKTLGFVFVTLALMVFLFKVIGGLGWKASVSGPILMTLFFYLLFQVWLKVQFPMGPF
jgi:putative tricarboxylic transport membrane protein